MFEECKNLSRTLSTVCLLTTPLTGLLFALWIATVLDDHSINTFGIIAGGISSSAFVFSVFHGVAAAFIRRNKLWAAQGALVLAVMWIVLGLVVFVAALLSASPVCLIGLVIMMGGVSGSNMACRAIAEIKADDGWSRDGPLRDSKGFPVMAVHLSEERGGKESMRHRDTESQR